MFGDENSLNRKKSKQFDSKTTLHEDKEVICISESPAVFKNRRNRSKRPGGYKLTETELLRISNVEWLQTTHFIKFQEVVRKHTSFDPQETFLIQNPSNIKPIPENQKHIQILYSRNHWIYTYYDGHSISIFDSLYDNQLDDLHKIYLNRLYPNYENRGLPIIFCKVQKQPNFSDCGVFAIAFATSLCFNIKPDNLKYKIPLMRPHLRKILETETLVHFPCYENFENSLLENDSENINKHVSLDGMLNGAGVIDI